MAKGDKRKRERKRVPKEERKNLRLWAEGACETILTPHLDGYQTALNQGWRQERKYLKKVCREYHARVDWRTLDHEEPVLDEWDPAALVVEEELSNDEEEARAARVKILNARIRRWFTYRLRKINKQRSGALDPTKDPYAVLLAKLSGLTAPPKARQAYQQFMRESYAEKIAPVVAEKWQKSQEQDGQLSARTKEPKAGFRAQVAREVFANLPSAEQKDIAARAKGEAAAAKLEYVNALKGPVSTSPEARQKCIDAVGEFMGPILSGLNQHTGLHATLILGGPMPKYGGELRSVHVSYGRNRTADAVHWPQWDKSRFAENVNKFMIDYLATAFSPQDCAQAALTDLNAAKYTIAPSTGVGEESDSDSDSGDSDDDSDSDTESGSDTDEEENGRARKKRKVGTDKPAAKKPVKAKKATAATSSSSAAALLTGSTAPPPAPASTAPAPTSTAPASTAPAPAPTAPAPASAAAPSTSTHVAAASTENEDEEEDEGEDDADPQPASRPWWQFTEAERQENIARNACLTEELRASIQADLQPLKDELRAMLKKPKLATKEPGAKPRPRKAKSAPIPGLPTRRSTRGKGAVGTAMDVDPAEGLDTGVMDVNTFGNALPPTPSTATSANPSQPTVTGAPSLTPATAPPSASTTTERSTSIPAPAPPSLASAPPSTPSAVSSSTTAADGRGNPTPSDTSTEAGNTNASTGAALMLPPLSHAAHDAIGPNAQTANPRPTPESSTPTFLPCPPQAAPWFVDAHAAMTKVDLGCHYHALVAAWTRMEQASRFEHGPTNLSHKGRPKQVTTWIGRLRKGTEVVVDDPAGYAIQWQAWWDSLQPAWRTKDLDGQWWVVGGYGDGGREWGPLYQWGVNGVLSVVASLYFWGRAVHENAELCSRWEAAVGDAVWMFEGMAAYYEMFKGKF